jgi:hypothetical protein
MRLRLVVIKHDGEPFSLVFLDRTCVTGMDTSCRAFTIWVTRKPVENNGSLTR